MHIMSPSFRHISAVQIELLFIVNGKNPDKLLSSKKMYLRNMQTMSLCGQLKKLFKGGVKELHHQPMYIFAVILQTGRQPKSLSVGSN